MKAVWKVAGMAAGVMVLAPVARAHELACEKTVNDEKFVEAIRFPMKLEYKLKVENVHPTSPSEVLEASDEVFEQLGGEAFDTPFTLPLHGSATESYTVNVEDYDHCLELAKLDGKEDDFIDNVFTVRWDSGSDVCTARVKCVKHEGPRDGRRMTGGGSVFGSGRKRVTHGLELRCDASDPRQNLEVNWEGHRFHLTALDSAECLDTPLDEGHPVAGFDTYKGKGEGRYDGMDGAHVEFVFTDAGEPGKDDEATILVKDKDGKTVLDVSGKLNFGNHQAH